MAPPNGGRNTVPRVKTYSAASGYVYQYQFTGHQSEPGGDRYRFTTTQDRRTPFDVFVSLPCAAIRAWETLQRRTLTSTERYAVAKLALFSALDAAESPEQIPEPVVVDAMQASDILSSLDI